MPQEQWKNTVNTSSSKRKERPLGEDDESGDGGKRRRKGGRRRKDKKSKANYELEEETELGDEHEEMDEEDANLMNNDQEDDGADKTRNNFVAAGLEDSDAEDDMVLPPFSFVFIQGLLHDLPFFFPWSSRRTLLTFINSTLLASLMDISVSK